MRDFSNDHSTLALNTATLSHNIANHGFGWVPERIIDECAERGYGGVVFWQREFANYNLEQIAKVGELVRAAGMQVPGLCRTPYIVGPEAPSPRSHLIAECERTIAIAGALQADSVTIVVGGVEAGSKGIDDSLKVVAEVTAELAPIAEQYGTRLGLEPLHPVYAGNRSCLVTMKDAVDIVEQINHPAVGIAVDVYHVWWDSQLKAALSRLRADQIHGFHLCDWLANTTDILLDRGMMGDGVADLKGLRSIVEDAGYNGLCEVEIFSANNWWKQPPELVLDEIVKRFRQYC